MSRSTQPLKELFTGVHLVAITDIIKSEGTNLIFRFSDGENKSFDKIYDYTGSEFIKLCHSAQLLKNGATFSRKESLGKRLWICIKEVWDVRGTDTLDTVNFYIFNTIPCDNPEKTPTVKGNPADNKGVAGGEFYGCRQVEQQPTEEEFMERKLTLKPLPPEKIKAIEEAREMIKAVESSTPVKEIKPTIFEKKAEEVKATEGVDDANWDEM